ncbi:MAG: 3-methyl-2-oxobutanoate hydroxymethyltransferase [Polyangiaceae bacterium]|jgi:3-methyl-2-oxobutanoate hydroxymethyltransferase|nr:3-methyl-2-oxobutanoate hydroxymethyltransferase [Polyangiaceae bacterium]
MKPSKVTVPALRARKNQGPKIVVLTAYDATMARLFDEAGVDAMLVGDSLGMVVQGQPNTLGVSIEDICYHGRAVARGTTRAHLVGDMPFMSFQVSPEEALRNAGRLIKEGCFEAVKLEGGIEAAESVRRIVSAGIPVMGHVGLTPQSVHAMGGFRVQGKSVEAAERVLEDARALEEAGAYAIVLEGIPSDLAARITDAVGVPTIGIGAGASCDGQVLVCYDMLGMFRERQIKFVKRFGEFGDGIVGAVRAYADEVRSGQFPGLEHTYGPVAPKPPAEGSAEPLRVIVGGYGPSDG